MQWVEGTAFYGWADQHVPSSRQLLQWLAQLASALAAGAVHRDVKGSNVLVRHQDRRVFLTDFGAGHHQGVAPLTGNALPPGTAACRLPEAWQPLPPSPPVPRHSPGPAGDVFALGVIGYQLAVGRYPPSTHPADEECYIWQQSRRGAHAPRAFNARCCQELSDLILRMLSVRPEDRGSARELAEALEDAARRAGPEADRPLWAQAVPPLVQRRALPAPAPVPPSPVPSRASRSWPLALVVALALVLGSGRLELFVEPGARLSVPAPPLGTDRGSAAVADESLKDPRQSFPQSSSERRIAWEMPPKPFRAQLRPDAKRCCNRTVEVIINEGCWLPIRRTRSCARTMATSTRANVISWSWSSLVLPSRVPRPRARGPDLARARFWLQVG